MKAIDQIFLDLQRQSLEAKAKALATPMNRKTSPCDTCAFKEGSETTGEPHNVLKAQLCLLGGHAFFCHHATDLHKTSDGNKATRAELRANGICHGWRTKTAERVKAGWFDRDIIAMRRAFGELGLALLNEFIGEKNKAKKRAAVRRLRACIALLSTKRLSGDLRKICR